MNNFSPALCNFSSQFFPPVSDADESGLLAVSGELTPEILFDSYVHGIFPWPFPVGDAEYLTGWFSPDPRGIIELQSFHVPRSVERELRRSTFEIRINTDFRNVILGCAARESPNETWITPEMIEAYCEFHRLGFAHCVEAWQNGRLVGGVYGVAIGGFFAAESMFYKISNASKVALVFLLRHLKSRLFSLVDIQMLTENTIRFGAIEISRYDYLYRLNMAVQSPVTFGYYRNIAE